MNLMRELRYKRDDLNEKLKEAPWWVWVVIAGVLLLIVLLPLTCMLRDPPAVTREQLQIEQTRGHLAAAYNEVVMRLGEQVSEPAAGGAPPRPKLEDAVSAIVAEKGADVFRCPVTGDAYRLNPDVRAWMLSVGGTPPPGVSTTDVLILTAAPPQLEEEGVAYLGLRPRRIPATLQGGEQPEWIDEALTPAG